MIAAGRLFCLGLLILAFPGCHVRTPQEKKPMTIEEASGVLDRHSASLMAIPGVMAVYVGAAGDGGHCLRVLVNESAREAAARIPQSLEGVPVEVEFSDHIRPLEARPGP